MRCRACGFDPCACGKEDYQTEVVVNINDGRQIVITRQEIDELIEYVGGHVDLDIEVIDEALASLQPGEEDRQQELMEEKTFLTVTLRPILRKLVGE